MSQSGKLTALSDSSTWSSKLRELVSNKDLSLLDYDFELKYDYWTYRTYVRDLCFVPI